MPCSPSRMPAIHHPKSLPMLNSVSAPRVAKPWHAQARRQKLVEAMRTPPRSDRYGAVTLTVSL